MRHFTNYLLALTCIVTIVVAPTQADLYSQSDKVLRLNADTFEPTIFRPNNDVTYVVQLYNSFCGHCQAFSPTYKLLAARVSNWTSVVRIAGIDCSKDENIETCRKSGTIGYPTIFFYPPNSKFNDPADAPLDLRTLTDHWTVDDIEELIIEFLGNLTRTNRRYPKAVDAMQPIVADETFKIKRLYPLDADFDRLLNDQNSLQDLMFIVESKESFLGRRLILEYFRLNAKLELRRILISNKKLLKDILRQEDYEQLSKNQPLLIRVNGLDKGAKAQVLVKGEANSMSTIEESERQDSITNRFKIFLDHYYSVELEEIDRHLGVSNPSATNYTKHINNEISAQVKGKQVELAISYLMHMDPLFRKKVFSQDLLKGISYMMTHEIRVKGDIKPSEFNTIRNLLTILKKYLPLEKWDPTLSKLVESLRTKLDENRSTYDKAGISSQQMKDLLDYSGSDEIRLKYNDESWISCYDSDRQHKGYTCSLWLLFHTLTVGEYTRASPVNIKPTLVLTTMRDYITKFLGCTICSSNFAKETENLESSLSARNSSVLWLWKTHNSVRQRLNNERLESQRKPLSKIIFPTHSGCQECYISSVDNIGADGKTLDDIEWNTNKVLEFMVDLYRPDHVMSPIELDRFMKSVQSKMVYEPTDGQGIDLIGHADLNSSSAEKWNIQSIFSASDMSICLFLYLSCIIIVAIVCISLNPKWRRTYKGR